MNRENRREFLERVGIASAVLLEGGRFSAGRGDREEFVTPRAAESWDMSWLERLKPAPYKAVIDASVLEEGYATDLAAGLVGDFKDTQGATEDQVRIVIVARRQGTPLVMSDAIWERYPIGEDTKTLDRNNAPLRRNPYFKQREGVIHLVCNIALNNWSRGLAQKTNRKQDDVFAEVKANLVPGTIVMPSGVFALMRAQNAGCAYMRGQ